MGVSVVPVSAIDPVSLIRHERVLATVGAVRMLEEKLS
jgi:ribosomal protein L4